MSHPPLVPPIKCQGIKTKLVVDILQLTQGKQYHRWVEPFCGSCVVPFNLQPPKALLCDTNTHIVRFYQDIQKHTIDAVSVKEFLKDAGAKLSAKGDDYFYQVRERFNANPNSLDFLFLNRSCFNGVMRFNRKGHFNVPFCRKPDRFAAALITKICNQISCMASVISETDWEFCAIGFRETFSQVVEGDFVYADPPYAGRHTDYFNRWSQEDEIDLGIQLANLRSPFILSTWHSNQFRSNWAMQVQWKDSRFHVFKKEHFYHVGSSEELRHPMTEALISNFPAVLAASNRAPVQTALPLCGVPIIGSVPETA